MVDGWRIMACPTANRPLRATAPQVPALFRFARTTAFITSGAELAESAAPGWARVWVQQGHKGIGILARAAARTSRRQIELKLPRLKRRTVRRAKTEAAGYSCRNAANGSILVARRAGT